MYTYDDTPGIYSIKLNGADKQTILEGKKASDLILINDILYFRSNYQICKVKTDGSDFSILNKDSVTFFTIEGQKNYYLSFEGIYKTNMDGSNKEKIIGYSDIYTQEIGNEFKVIDNNIYFSGQYIIGNSVLDNLYIQSIKTDGTDRKRLISFGTFASLNSVQYEIYGDRIYINYGGKLLSYKMDGTDRKELVTSFPGLLYIIENKIYGFYINETFNLYVHDIDGKNRKPIIA